MKVSVDATRCQGHTLCAIAAPEIFRLRDEDGHAYVDDENVAPGLTDTAREAYETCPERAITITE